MRKKLFKLKKKVEKGRVEKERLLECFNSWKAHANQGDSWKVVEKIKKMLIF